MSRPSESYQQLVSAAIPLVQKANQNPTPGDAPSPYQTNDAERVALLIKGFGSSSADPTMTRIVDIFESNGIATCIYSYRGVQDRNYTSTTSTFFPSGGHRLTQLAGFINDFIGLFPKMKELYIVAHSFGGNIVAQWLCTLGNNLALLTRPLRWITLLASPINLDPLQFRLELQIQNMSQTQDVVIDVEDYDADFYCMLDQTNLHVLLATRDDVVDRALAELPGAQSLTDEQRQRVKGPNLEIPTTHYRLPLDQHTTSYLSYFQ